MTQFLEVDPLFRSPDTTQSSEFIQYSEKRLRLLSRTFDRVTKMLDQNGRMGEFDLYRQIHYVMASLCKEPVFEQEIVEEVDGETHRETIDELAKETFSTECLVVGTGPAGVSFASKLRQLHPAARVLMVDDRDFRGGQFADPGFNYKLNTPKEGPLGFAGELSDPNNLGEAAFLQITDISADDEDYFRRKKLATCLKIDGFLAAPALVGTKVVSVERSGHGDSRYVVAALHKATGREALLYPDVVVFARGRGKPKYGIDLISPDTQETLATRGDRIFVSEEFNAHVDASSPSGLLQDIKNGVAMIGAGDSANTALEAVLNKLLTILSPDEIQKLRIDVYGAKYLNDQQFLEDVRIPRYAALQPYIGNFIFPHKDKATELMTVGKRSIGIKTATSLGIYGTIAMLTGYQNPPIEHVVRMADRRVIDVMGDGEFEGEMIAQKFEGENIFTVGIDTRERFSGRPPVFARSIVRYTPRILATAEMIAGLLQNA